YMSELGILGGEAGAAKLREQLGEKGYGKQTLPRFPCVRMFLTSVFCFPRFRAHFVRMAKASHKARRERLGEEGWQAHFVSMGKASMVAQREKYGKKFGAHRSKASKKSSDTFRDKIGEEAYGEFMHKKREVLMLSAINLDVAHPAGFSDETDFQIRNGLKRRLTDWKKKKGLSKENEDDDPNVQQMKALMKGYLPGFNKENNRRGANKSRAKKNAKKNTKATFQGNFLSNVKNGLFVVTFEDGRQYDGHFQLGAMGKGTMTFHDADGEATYYGHFDVQGQPHGRGKLRWNKDLNEYDGQFYHGVMEGHGRMTYKKDVDNVSYYLGEFENAERHGMGVLVVNESIQYEGRWHNDQPIDHDDLSDSSSSFCGPKEMETGFCGQRLVGRIPKNLSPCSRYTNRLMARRRRRAQ
ncbi:MAG: hypothetical protein SGILL_007522, partial [Bacillariaceae sp.]